MFENYDKKDIAVYISFIVIVIIGIWLVFGNAFDGDSEEDTIVITNSDGEEFELYVEIADEPDERVEGLMNRETLCEDCGMLFVYSHDVHGSFWMKNTKIPLSIAFISEDGDIMEIQQMEPETTEKHTPEEEYRYALEVNQGYFEERGIDAGDEVDIPERFDID